MFIKICSFPLVLVLAASLSASTLTWDHTETRIELKPDEKEARAVYTVTNTGDKTIRIDRVKTTCGCTGSILKKKIIEPGDSAEIVGTFHKGKRQGLNHNQLEIFIDGQAESVATLHMIVQVPQLIELQPKIIYWNQESNQTERVVRIKLDKRYIKTISDIIYNKDTLTLVREPDPADKEKEILRILPKSFNSVLRETIVIQADGEEDLDAERRLHVFVQP